MTLLLDTHVFLRAAGFPDRLPADVIESLEDPHTELVYSAASLWEVAIKSGLGRADFRIDPRLLRRGLLENGYRELAVTGAHAAAVDLLPRIHRDPFDRILVAQAQIEGITLVTMDEVVGRYPGPIRVVPNRGVGLTADADSGLRRSVESARTGGATHRHPLSGPAAPASRG